MEQDRKNLISEANNVQKNIDWWISEVSKAIDDIDEIDSNPSLSEEEVKTRFNRLEYLVGKADTEIKDLDDLEVKSIRYFKKLYDESKRKTKPVVKSKKRRIS